MVYFCGGNCALLPMRLLRFKQVRRIRAFGPVCFLRCLVGLLKGGKKRPGKFQKNGQKV